MPINDGWLRDWGPTCIARPDPVTGKRQVAGVHWDYDCCEYPADSTPLLLAVIASYGTFSEQHSTMLLLVDTTALVLHAMQQHC